jgi:hypothetical protein
MKLALVGDSLRATFRPWSLWLAEFLLNPVFALLAVVWLQLPETAGGLTLTVLLGLVIVVGSLTLAGATLAWFVEHHEGGAPTLRGAFGKGLRHFWLLGIWGLVMLVGCHVVEWMRGYEYQFPNYVRSMMPAGMRNVFSEQMVHSLYLWKLAFLFWVILPALWLPPAAQLAAQGFRGFGRDGFRAWGRSLKSWQYWLMVALCALVGVWMPMLLMGMAPTESINPPPPPLSTQMMSLIFRLAISYALALFGWMWVASATGRAGTVSSAQADSK